MDSVQPYLFVTSKKTYQFTYSQFWLPSGTSLKMYLTLCKIRTHIQFIQDMSELLILMTQAIFWMIFFSYKLKYFYFCLAIFLAFVTVLPVEGCCFDDLLNMLGWCTFWHMVFLYIVNLSTFSLHFWNAFPQILTNDWLHLTEENEVYLT